MIDHSDEIGWARLNMIVAKFGLFVMIFKKNIVFLQFEKE